MDFGWSDEQLSQKQEVIAFAEEHLNDELVARNRDGIWCSERWRKCAEYGIQGLTVPKAYGGREMDIPTAVLTMEGLGYGCRENGLPYALSSHIWVMQPVLERFGNEVQKQKYLTKMVSGEWLAGFGMTEDETGSDSYALQTTATRVEGGYVLNGMKDHITFAPICDFAIIFAMTNPEHGKWGISAFLLDRDTPGFRTSDAIEKMGSRSVPFGRLFCDNCFVPEENRLGAEGVGVSIFTNILETERSYIFAAQVGRMERQLEENIAYANKRKAFGQSIGKFQSVSNRIVDMKVRLETAKLLLYKVAWLDQHNKPHLIEAAMAKLYLSEMFVQSSLDAIRNHGSNGYVTNFEIERDLRDGIGGVIYSGTSDIQRVIIARLLGL